jgi:hypothetical protein
MEFSDYVVYVDESGDHELGNINSDYPLFVLSFCVFPIRAYVEKITPALRGLKFATFGHDMVVFREHNIRKREPPFHRMNRESRELFIETLTGLIREADFTLIAVVIDKLKLKKAYTAPSHPYHLAVEFGMERVHHFLRHHHQENLMTHFVFEARGAKEDETLELEFRRLRDGANGFHTSLRFEIIIADKKVNSEGLQLADMTARPIGLSVLRPDQANRAVDALQGKFYRGGNGEALGFGLKVFP